jgi:hypothetical protein
VSSPAGTPGPAPRRQYERTDVVLEPGGLYAIRSFTGQSARVTRYTRPELLEIGDQISALGAIPREAPAIRGAGEFVASASGKPGAGVLLRRRAADQPGHSHAADPPADQGSGGGPDPARGLPWLDAHVAAGGYLRTSPWTWANGEWSALTREITVPADIQVRHGDQASPLTVEEAVRDAAAGATLTVTQVDHDGKLVPGVGAFLCPAGTAPGTGDGPPGPGVLVSVPDPHPADRHPAPGWPVVRARLACHALAVDIAEAATLYAAAVPARQTGASQRDRRRSPDREL